VRNECLDEPFDRSPFGGRAGSRRGLKLVAVLEVAAQRRTGALQRAGDRFLGGVKDVRDLAGTVTEDVAQDQHRPLPRR
jgi:hypothetical protein